MGSLEKHNVTYRQSAQSDHRKHKRKRYGASVDLTIDSITYIAEISDLSLSGAFISGDHLPPIEQEAKVTLSIPYENKPWAVELTGTVRRLTEKGFGVEFF
jgi:hypothetical protein